MTRFGGMFENMVRAANPIQFPSGSFKVFDEVCALHVCIIHTR